MGKINFLEADLENVIEATPIDRLRERGLSVRGGTEFLRQFRVGNYGICDLVGLSVAEYNEVEYRYIQVFELKQNEINIAALLQLCRYLKAFESIFPNDTISGVLIGRTIDLKSDFIYLLKQCEYGITAYTYDLNIDGFRFAQINAASYGLVNPGKMQDAKETVELAFQNECETVRLPLASNAETKEGNEDPF